MYVLQIIQKIDLLFINYIYRQTNKQYNL